MSTFETFYDINPISVVDQNQWDWRTPEIALQFRQQPVMYTPLIDWNDATQQTGARNTWYTEMMEGDIDIEEIPLTANYIDQTLGVDSRSRTLTTTRYGDKVQLHESSNIFQMWQTSGGRDWRPLLRGMLGRSVVNKFERLARNSYMRGPKTFWTYANGQATINAIGSADTFNMDIVNQWNLRLGNTGSPIVPGQSAGAKMAIIPPGVIYDFYSSLAQASTNEASMWRDAQLYSGQALRYELGSFKNIRFIEHPNDLYGQNGAVLYNSGVIGKQFGVTAPINMGDGAPDPETTKVDDVWYVGQKGVTHYVQLEDFAQNDYAVGDIVTIHYYRTSDFGVTNGVDFLAPKVTNRRVVAVDYTLNRLSFDRPVMLKYQQAFSATPVSGGAGTYYAFVTKARHIGFILVLGSRGGIRGEVARPINFHEPKPIDDFESVWRYVWDIVAGYNIWEPNLFECHFCAVTLPKAGGLITP